MAKTDITKPFASKAPSNKIEYSSQAKADDDREKLRSETGFNKSLSRAYERKRSQADQEIRYAHQKRNEYLKGGFFNHPEMPNPPENRQFYSQQYLRQEDLPKDIDTPQPQMSPVKRQAKAAERQRMKTPGMGDVKAAERLDAKPKTVGSILIGQMMKQQPSKKR